VVPAKKDDSAGRGPAEGAASADLTWLAHRAAEALGEAFNQVSREAGLSDLRDWLVLALAADGPARTQLEIATELGIDKTTLVSILDRLERDGLIIRKVSPRDRRVRYPEVTPKGIEVKDQVAIARGTAVRKRLAAIPESEHARFHAMLWSIVEGG
jgi:DNA-binding MarR family transcriptional regulator